MPKRKPSPAELLEALGLPVNAYLITRANAEVWLQQGEAGEVGRRAQVGPVRRAGSR